VRVTVSRDYTSNANKIDRNSGIIAEKLLISGKSAHLVIYPTKNSDISQEKLII
jgi:hypothetical protein